MPEISNAQIIIYGGGNMGTALAKGILHCKLISANRLIIVEKETTRREVLERTMPCVVCETYACKPNQVILLAVKPDDFENLATGLVNQATNGNLVLSVMAGITVTEIKNRINCTNVVRAIPNTPSSVLKGMSVYYTDAEFDETYNNIAKNILDSVGLTIRVTHEEMIDKATSICGSGPAYLFYIAESMVTCALEFGFSSSEATTLVNQALLGAATLLSESKRSPEELRREVMTPNGTTAAAINYFEAHGVKEALQGGYRKSFERSQELGRGKFA
jgi:pyrroline-5-carboxylate reductase